jgi:hypothetical protein
VLPPNHFGGILFFNPQGIKENIYKLTIFIIREYVKMSSKYGQIQAHIFFFSKKQKPPDFSRGLS